MDKKFSVLWIEDDYYEINAIMRRLVEDGNSLDPATSVTTAYRKLFKEKKQYDLIVLDCILPIKDEYGYTDPEVVGWDEKKRPFGITLLEKLVQAEPNQKVIILSIVADPLHKYPVQLLEGKNIPVFLKHAVKYETFYEQLKEIVFNKDAK